MLNGQSSTSTCRLLTHSLRWEPSNQTSPCGTGSLAGEEHELEGHLTSGGRHNPRAERREHGGRVASHRQGGAAEKRTGDLKVEWTDATNDLHLDSSSKSIRACVSPPPSSCSLFVAPLVKVTFPASIFLASTLTLSDVVERNIQPASSPPPALVSLDRLSNRFLPHSSATSEST